MPQRDHPRNTKQRQMILDEVRSLSSHPTAAELYELVRRHLPKISLGTVYRNLELLAQLGMIQKISSCGAQARFDGNPQPHHHVRCVRCGRIDDLPGAPLDDFGPADQDAWVQPPDGYEILGCRVEFFGVCPGCRKGPAA